MAVDAGGPFATPQWKWAHYADGVPPPRRRAPLGSQESVLDDLALARDMVGLARCSRERLRGTLYLTYGAEPWDDAHVVFVRDLLQQAIDQARAGFLLLHPNDPCSKAAAESIWEIMSQPEDGQVTASVIRRRSRQKYGCHIADDSLRKREQPILQMAAKAIFTGLKARMIQEMPNTQGVLDLLQPFAELAGDAVAVAAKRFSQRAALQDDDILPTAVARAIWAVAQLGVLPLYGEQRLQQMGGDALVLDTIEWLILGIIRVPFVQQPGDLDDLSTAIRPNEDPADFYGRLLATPVMRPVVKRFVAWISTHDPKVCLVDSNDVMIGYCGPHYYASLCSELSDAAEEYRTGELRRDLHEMLDGLKKPRF